MGRFAVWRSVEPGVHASHHLCVHRPLLFCIRCGASAQANLHLSSLLTPGTGEPTAPATRFYMRRRLLNGIHPHKKTILEGKPTMLPIGHGT